MNTALGNTVVSGICVLAVAGNIQKLSILVEGDDGVVFGPAEEIEKLSKTISPTRWRWASS